MKKNLLLFALLTGVVVTSCSEDDDNNEEPVELVSGSLTVSDQEYDGSTVTVDHVEISDDGWIAIYQYTAEGDELLGYAFVEEGEHEDIVVELDENVKIVNGQSLLALLHLDVNSNGIFDWEGNNKKDLPLMIANQKVSKSFYLSVEDPGSLTVRNQMYQDRTVVIDQVKLKDNGWLAIYRYDTQRRELLGYTFLEAGEHEDIKIVFNGNIEVQHGERFQAVLHRDVNENEIFEWNAENEIDLPLFLGSNEISDFFSVMTSTEYADHWISIKDQPLRSGPFESSITATSLHLEEIQHLIESNFVWVVAYNNGIGAPGELIGISDIQNVNNHEEVIIWISGEAKRGDIIWLALHADMGESGEFDYEQNSEDKVVYDPVSQKFMIATMTITKQ